MRHQLLDERSLAFDRLTAAKVESDPALLEIAHDNLRRWLATCSPAVRPVLLEWQAVLDGPLDDLLNLLTATDERARRLRQSSPFAGVLSNAERTGIIQEFAQRDPAAT